ncbi:DUF3422 domain-containing protein [uncultured Litoreibacter sp.]|uniref:DUF3422 family protein n=1 Tax=uncultured Litoreibacter sp. TaxID=1392394 RepID=UPI00261DA556|nr:DUF3422 domain-containing protein [uncultured Litoreibacter sp.]
MPPIEDHPLRYALANELHARPFPTLLAPCEAIYLAIKRSEKAADRDRNADRAHLTELLDRYGAAHPQPGATHWFGDVGKFKLKWEQHTEFVTYTLFMPSMEGRAFDPVSFEIFPNDWLATAPGVRITSALIRVEADSSKEEISKLVDDWFVPESLAVSTVLDGAATIAGDFRIDAAGHMRLAVFVKAETGQRRIGRIVQRLCEIETYKSMSMLGLARARELQPRMGVLDGTLSGLMSAMTQGGTGAEDTLRELLETSAELENLLAESSFRFGATRAYEAIVNQRIEVLRETRFEGRQSFADFMMRRFDPAMRTVKATERRLQTMAQRAIRAGDLLRTRVDVERSAQNQKLLESMDQRADLQLRLQKTVEGLSVVAISYYAVNLVLYMAQPAAYAFGVSKLLLAAVTTPVVVLIVWWMVHKIREKME